MLVGATAETLRLLEEIQRGGDFAKSITTATGLVAYDLQAPAKNLYPVITPIRNRLPRVAGNGGTATHWVAVNAIIGSGVSSMGWVPEGQRSGPMSYSTANVAATYVTMGEEDQVSFESVSAGRGFEDVKASMVLRLLQKYMLKQENAYLGGNKSIQLGTPSSAPTVSASGTGATLPAATYSVIVVPLTLEGFLAASLSSGVVQTQAITGQDGKPYTLNGGSGNKSSNNTQAVTLGQTLFASIAPITGAVAYAWYVGTAGAETLQAITTINSASFSAPLTSGQQAATAITADCSYNANYAFDGLLSTAFKGGSGAYIAVQATGTAGTGTPLTSSGRGSVQEIDTMLKAMWDNWRVSPTVLWVNSQEQKNITNKVLSTGSAPLLQFRTEGKEPLAIVAGGVVAYYYNPFAMNGGVNIPVMLHPTLPPGTIMGWCENLPIQYQNNNVPNVAEVHCRQDYYQIDWPLVTRAWQSGVYSEEVLAVYAPFAIGIITNIGNG
jgi:hypothetical protein